MNTQEALLKYQQNFNKNLRKELSTEIHSKEQFFKYGAQSTIITLLSNLPDFYDANNEKIELENKTSKLLSLQQLEKLLYLNGVAAFRYDWKPAEVIDYVEVNEVLTYLKVKLEFFTSQYSFYVFEEYKYENGELVFEYSITKPENISNEEVKDLLWNRFLYSPITNYIPYKMFYNNYLKLPDLYFVNNEYFELMNRDLSVLMEDSFLSAPWIFATDSSNIKEKIERGLHSLKERFIALNDRVALYEADPLKMLQGNSQAQILIEKIEKNITWIKKFGFMKQDSNNFGTKNMHNAEVQEINSDFEDYIEAKANLRQLQLLEFAEQGLNEEVKKVLMYGSTEWLQTEAKKYAVDMNGSLINQNAYETNEEAALETKENNGTINK